MIPLVFSAGPANIMLAAFGSRFGFAKTFPFLSGILAVMASQVILVGMGIDQFLRVYPRLLHLIQAAGAVYLVYLAYKFFKSTQVETVSVEREPSFMDGILLQGLNMKGLVINTVMFSQFLTVDEAHWMQVLLLSGGLIVLATSSMVTWTLGGAWLTRRLSSYATSRMQGYVFGCMLLGVAVWMLL